MNQLEAQAAETARELADRLGIEDSIDAGLILGSGMSGALSGETVKAIERSRIASLPPVIVPGHGDRLRLVSVGSGTILCFEGRNHLYEGVSASDVALPVAICKQLGATRLITVTAAGGIHPEFALGDLVIVNDQLNLSAASPLLGSCFVSMEECYDPGLRRMAIKALTSLGLAAKEGVLASLRGPQYETAAEIRFLKGAGADLVSMSMAMETIAARALGLAVLGVALVVNQAAGLSSRPIDHADVIRQSGNTTDRLSAFLRRLAEELPAG